VLRNLTDRLFQLRINPAQLSRLRVITDLNENQSFQSGGRAGHTGDFFQGGQDLFRLAHDAAVFDHFDMRVKTENPFAPRFVKTGHHRKNDDEHGDTKGDAEKRKQRDDRKERPLGLQVLKCQKE